MNALRTCLKSSNMASNYTDKTFKIISLINNFTSNSIHINEIIE